MTICLINLNEPPLSMVKDAFAEEHWSLVRPQNNCSNYFRIRAKDELTNKIHDVFLNKLGIEALGISRDLPNHEAKLSLLRDRMDIVSFFAALQFPPSTVRMALKSSIEVKGCMEKIKNFLYIWGFQENVIDAAERKGCLEFLVKLVKLDFHFACLNGLPTRFLSEPLPIPNLSMEDLPGNGYINLLQKAQLRREGVSESELSLERPNHSILLRSLFKEKYADFIEKKREQIADILNLVSLQDNQIEMLYLLGLFDIFYSNVQKYASDIASIDIRQRIDNLRNIIRILSKNNPQLEWMLFQVERHSIVQESNLHLSELATQFQTWLETSTYFPGIETQFSEEERKIKVRQFKTAFLIAENTLVSSKGYAVPVRMCEDNNYSFIAYKTKENKTSLCSWSGYWHLLRSDKDCLGSGTYGTVQKVRCLGTGKIMALKAPLNGETESIYNEIKYLNMFSHLSPHFNKLNAIVRDGDLIAYMREFRETDLLNAILSVSEYELTFDGVYRSFLELLYALNVMVEKKIAHFDLKENNILCDYNKDTKSFRCFLEDFGMSRSYKEIRGLKKNQRFPSATTLESDRVILDLSSKSGFFFNHSVEKTELRSLALIFYAFLTARPFCSSRVKWKRLEAVHGEKITSIIRGMLNQDANKRLNVKQVIQGFEGHAKDENPTIVEMRNRPFTRKCQDDAW